MHINLHINLCLPRALQRMQRRVDNTCKFIGNYLYYRKRHHGHSMAWSMARDTF